jgi:hypothetical protein
MAGLVPAIHALAAIEKIDGHAADYASLHTLLQMSESSELRNVSSTGV